VLGDLSQVEKNADLSPPRWLVVVASRRSCTPW